MLERNLRLVSGLVVVLFVTLHLINHSLGLINLEAMEELRQVLAAFWHFLPITIILYLALLTHFVLAFVALARRTSWNMPWWQIVQYALGFSVPLMLIPHVIGARLMPAMLPAIEGGYEWVLGSLWNTDGLMFRQSVLLLVVWTHICFGLHYWLRMRSGYRRWLSLWQLIAMLIPILALLGFYRAANDVGVIDLGERWQRVTAGYPDVGEEINAIKTALEMLFWSGLMVVAAYHLTRLYRLRRRTFMYVTHPEHGKLKAAPEMTLLEVLRQHRVPHSAVCGGRGRCTTCRVRITEGVEQAAEISDGEQQVLASIGAGEGVRLACQFRVKQSMTIEPLLKPGGGLHQMNRPGGVAGFEKPVAVLFADLRGSTALGEQRLPYDVVFILNQFFAELSQALEQTGGHYAQFNGDGLMALYGVEGDYTAACRNAVRGALAMQEGLDRLNLKLVDELPEPLRMGIGLHCGDAIVGTMGPPASPILSAVGDTVNSAARLEQSSKEMKKSLVLSVRILQQANIQFDESLAESIPVRGRQDTLAVVGVSVGDDLWHHLQQVLAIKT